MNRHFQVAAVATLLAAGATSAAPMSTTDFFRDPQFYGTEISPDGDQLAVTVPVKGKRSLAVFTDLDKKPLKPIALFDMEGDFDVHSFFWVGNDQLVFNTAERTGEFNQPVLHEDLYRASVHDLKLSPLFNASYVRVIDRRSRDDAHVLVSVRGVAQSLDIRSGDFHDLGDAGLNGATYFANHKGEVLLAIGASQTTEDESVLEYRAKPSSGSWKDLVAQKDTLDYIRPVTGLGYSADDQTFYYASDEDGGITGVYALDLASGGRKLVFRDARYDLGGPIISRDSAPIGVRVGKGMPREVYFDDNSPEAKLRKEIADLFPGEDIVLNSYSRDASKGIVMAISDRQPPRCYLVDLKANEVRLLFNSEPWIDPAQMSPMQAVQLKARDGLPIDGFLTMPTASGGKNLPLVVIPHGGPFGMSDQWGYNPEVQFLAYHGYAVLQVNYRGSGGYGRNFLQAGFRQWGEKIQDDIIDATNWAIAQSVADKDRVCIFGGSFGGYSALEAPIRQPGLYKCAVGYAGAYDLNLLLMYKGGGKYWHKTLGEYGDHLAEFSPARHAADIRVPVLLVHGKDDKTVPFDQYEAMAKALEKAGNPAELMAVEKERHGFYKVENKVAFYDKLLAFLDRNIGPKAAPKGQVMSAP